MGTGHRRHALTAWVHRVPESIQIAVAVAWLAMVIFIRWQSDTGHETPAALSVVLVVGVFLIACSGLVQFLRSSYAADRPQLELSHGWVGFFVVTACLIGVPVIGVFDDDSQGDFAIGVFMVLTGLVLIGLFIRYMRKPVRDHGSTVAEFYSENKARRRSAKVYYGEDWHLVGDPHGRYTLVWLESTHEICAVRYPALPTRLRYEPAWVMSSSYPDDVAGVAVLGWADDQLALDQALSGWERIVEEPDGMAWVRKRLDEAAAKTKAAQSPLEDRRSTAPNYGE